MWRLFIGLCVVVSLVTPARSAMPAGLIFDDGFTWIECRNFTVTENNLPVGRWVPVCNLRVLGPVPDRSGFHIVLKKEGTKLAEYTHDGFPVRAADQTVGMSIVGWWKQTPQIAVDGLLDVEVYYIDGKTDVESLAKTCKLDVRHVATERGSVGERSPGPVGFFVNAHAEALSNLLYFRPGGFPSYTGVDAVGTQDQASLELIMTYAESADFSGPRVGRIKVEVDNKPIDMMVPGNNVPQDEIGQGSIAGKYSVEHSDRAAEKYFSAGPSYRERIGFCRRSFVLPLSFGPKPADRPQSRIFASDHPGEWKIIWLIDRQPVRIFRFKVGADGMPVPHAEQGQGLNLLPGAILVDTEIPGEGGDFDGRLTSEFAKVGGFYGRPWASDTMKAAAEKIPTKGAPFPVPSDKQ